MSRREVSVVRLLFGLATLVASAYVLTDGEIWVPGWDGRWVLAGGALLVGLVFLGASVGGRRRG